MTALTNYEDWQSQAACRGQSASIFFAPPHFERRSAKLDREARAKAVCASCTVRKECLSYALRIGEAHGIWGGLTEEERSHLVTR
jgi:WhiB family redox-sensing transcriptional regulator